MGNQLTSPSRLAPSEAVGDLQGLTYKDSLGERACREGAESVGPPLAGCSLHLSLPLL